jgi:CheY-like chemotaxis protein
MTKVLVVEDSATDMAMMRALLDRAGYDVCTANNGLEAIELLHRELPDAVVTDLQMPEMNGEELVCRVADEFPTVPVVLATAHGSESLAADALAHGAVNFVPKTSVTSLLPGVMRRTLAIAKADESCRDVPGQLRSPEFYFKLDNRIAAIEPAVSFLTQVLSAAKVMTPTTRLRIGTAVASAIFNAICYGNLELTDEDERVASLLTGDERSDAALVDQFGDSPYANRVVRLKVSVDRSDTRISVSHEGHGRLVRMRPAPGTPASFELEQCRGWLLITSFMDEVLLDTDSSEVVLVKRHG